MVKDNGVHTHNRILVSLKKERSPVTGDNRLSLEDIMLSEVHQSQKDTHGLIPLTRDTKIAKISEAEDITLVARYGGEGKWEVFVPVGIKCQICKMSTFQRSAVNIVYS